jgi:hypothetical protein
MPYPYEIYVVPHDPEKELIFMPILPGQHMATISLEGENVDAIALTCEPEDDEVLVYRKKIGPKNKTQVLAASELVIHDNIKGKATPDENCYIKIADLDGSRATMVVRRAGKAALCPELN